MGGKNVVNADSVIDLTSLLTESAPEAFTSQHHIGNPYRACTSTLSCVYLCYQRLLAKRGYTWTCASMLRPGLHVSQRLWYLPFTFMAHVYCASVSHERQVVHEFDYTNGILVAG